MVEGQGTFWGRMAEPKPLGNTRFPGRVVDIRTGDCQAGTDFSYPTGLSFSFKMSFQARSEHL